MQAADQSYAPPVEPDYAQPADQGYMQPVDQGYALPQVPDQGYGFGA